MNERDERPLEEIQFALDFERLHGAPLYGDVVRQVFKSVGVKVAQDIVDLGCTGLFVELHKQDTGVRSLRLAQEIRQSMSGSICGLPCYVPPDRFCLVHGISGALQLQGNADGPQAMRYPEGIPYCSRELTAEERKAHGQIQAKLMTDAATAAEDMGAEVLAIETSEVVQIKPLPPLRTFAAPFKCPEHQDFTSACRFCLAQAVAEGPLDPQQIIQVRVGSDDGFITSGRPLREVLADDQASEVQVVVLAARWTRKLTRE